MNDPFDAVSDLPDLKTRSFRTPGAGTTSRPFQVAAAGPDGLEVRTSRGGRVTLRAEAFQGAVKVVSDLSVDDPDGWVRASDETLQAVLQSENRDKAVGSYVLPLLEAAGLVELDRGRPSRVRIPRAST